MITIDFETSTFNKVLVIDSPMQMSKASVAMLISQTARGYVSKLPLIKYCLHFLNTSLASIVRYIDTFLLV